MTIKPIQAHKIEKSVETDIKKAIEELCDGYVIKNQASHTTGRGKPDLSACIHGKYYGIEVKRKGSNIHTTPAQLQNLKQIAKAGGYAFYSKTIDVISPKWLEEYNKTVDKTVTFEQILHYLHKKSVQAIQIKYALHDTYELLIYSN